MRNFSKEELERNVSQLKWILWISPTYSEYLSFVSHLTALRRSALLHDVTQHLKPSKCLLSLKIFDHEKRKHNEIFWSCWKYQNIYSMRHGTHHSTSPECWHFWHDARFLFDAALLSLEQSLGEVTSFRNPLIIFKQSLFFRGWLS